jgi:hypothetical protein
LPILRICGSFGDNCCRPYFDEKRISFLSAP